MKRSVALLLACSALAGCVSARFGYAPPTTSQLPLYTKEISRPRDAVWNDAVAALGQRFFVINNLDKASGLINISYSGDPAQYVDCGIVTLNISGVRERTQTFQGAAADTRYETVGPVPPYGFQGPIYVHRQMSLDGRVNVIFEAPTPSSTRITAATRYVVTRRYSASNASRSDTIGFNGNEKGVFPQNPGASQGLECTATGQLERGILSLIN